MMRTRSPTPMPSVARDARADGDALARSGRGRRARSRGRRRGGSPRGPAGAMPKTSTPELRPWKVAITCPFTSGRGAGDAGDGGDAGGDRGGVVDGARAARPARRLGLGVDGDVGVGAEDRVHELLAEARADGERGHEREDREGDAHEADPGHHRDAALGAPGAQVAPGDHPLEAGEGGGLRAMDGPLGDRAARSGGGAGGVKRRAGPRRRRRVVAGVRRRSPSVGGAAGLTSGCRATATPRSPAPRRAPCPARPEEAAAEHLARGPASITARLWPSAL